LPGIQLICEGVALSSLAWQVRQNAGNINSCLCHI
jgi:hypothetical protein